MQVLDLDSQYWSGQILNIESLKRLYSVRWGENKWPRRPLGMNYSVEACGHCVKVGLVVLLLKRELYSLTESLRWWWSGWSPLLVTMWVIPEDLGSFSPKKGEKSWGAKIHVFWRWIFANQNTLFTLYHINLIYLDIYALILSGYFIDI
jgi:hypothetical protein